MTPTIELSDNQCSSSTSETVDNSKSITKTSDLRKMSHKSYEKQFPQFYYSATEDGWYCKICSSFSDIRITDQAFVNKAGTFGDHPSCRSNKHLSSARHQESLKNKQAYDELSKKNTNVWKLSQKASLSQAALKTTNNRYVIKCFFRVTFLLAKKHWAHTHNFDSLVDLIGRCGGKEVETHLLTTLKNANYMSPLFIAKYISIINHYIEEQLLASLRDNKYSLYNDETQDITSVE